MKWVKLHKTDTDIQIYARIDDDGLIRVTCVEQYPEFQQWISEGNTAEEITVE